MPLKSTLKIILAILFLICLIDMPYAYYMFVRLAGMIGFIYFAYLDKENRILLLLWIGSAILINPIFKIPLGRELWNIVDVIWAIILVIDLVLRNKLNKIATGKSFSIFNIEISYSKNNNTNNSSLEQGYEYNIKNDKKEKLINILTKLYKLYDEILFFPFMLSFLLIGLIVITILFINLNYRDFLLSIGLLLLAYHVLKFVFRILWSIFTIYILKVDINLDESLQLKSEINKSDDNSIDLEDNNSNEKVELDDNSKPNNEILWNEINRKHHDIFSHQYLRKIFFRNPSNFRSVSFNEKSLNPVHYLKYIWYKAGKSYCDKNEISESNGFDIKFFEITDSIFITVITLPRPKYILECYYIGLVLIYNSNGKIKNYRYFTLEIGASDDPHICEWDKNGDHLNYGQTMKPQIDNFISSIIKICKLI